MKLTISVLIYNIEDYLNCCLKSIVEQMTDDDIQLLLIDDGSTDSSGSISDYYAARDDRIKVIHKVNGGVSSARNTAIDNAEGDYIWFVDGDDIIVKNSIHKLIEYLNTALVLPEVLICDYYCFDKEIIKPQAIKNIYNEWKEKASSPGKNADIKSEEFHVDRNFENLNGRQCVFLWGICIFGVVWNCVFQRQYVLNSHMRFDEKLYCNEDEDWLVPILYFAQSITIMNEFIYKYRTDRVGSITNEKDLLNKFKCQYKVYTKWFDYFANCQCQNASTKHMTAYFAELYTGLARIIKNMDVCNKREAIKMYKDRITITSHTSRHSSDYPFKWWNWKE